MNSIITAISTQYDVLLILLCTAWACGIIGCFLVLREVSMISDAISHSVLLGIVLAFFLTQSLDSPWLLIGAAIFGVATVWSIESLSRTTLLKKQDAIGVLFPIFFAIAVILITKFAKHVHLDLDVVLMGDIIMAPLHTITLGGMHIPQAFVQMGTLCVANGLFIWLFFKELSITTFDGTYAFLCGFTSTFLFYGLMTLASLTAVAAFDVVGSILVVSFLIAPSASAILITKRLSHTIFITLAYSTVNAFVGFLLAILSNLSVSGMTAMVAGVTFTLTVLFRPGGLCSHAWHRYQEKKDLAVSLLLIHIGTHTGSPNEGDELGFHSLRHHMSWSERYFMNVRARAMARKWIFEYAPLHTYRLTEEGERIYRNLCDEYHL